MFSLAGLRALVAQGLTFAAAVMPIAFGLNDALIGAVLTSAIVTVLVHPSTLAASTRLSPIANSAIALRSIAASFVSLFVVSAAITGLGLARVMLNLGSDALLVAVLLLPQGLYVIALAESVRELSFGTVANLRLAYGIAAAGLTLLACLFVKTTYSLVLATAIAYLIASLVCAARFGLVRGMRKIAGAISFTSVFGQIRKNWAFSLALGFGNIASQAPGLAVGLIGPLAPAWSVMTRIGSGFQTIGGAVLGPTVDIGVSKSMQESDSSLLGRSLKKATLFGIALAAIGAAVMVAAVTLQGIAIGDSPALLVALGLFWVPQMFVATIGRSLALLGWGKLQLAQDIFKVLLTVGILLTLRGADLLVGISILTLISTLVYLVALAIASRKFR
jgi:hypothetical protein